MHMLIMIVIVVLILGGAAIAYVLRQRRDSAARAQAEGSAGTWPSDGGDDGLT